MECKEEKERGIKQSKKKKKKRDNKNKRKEKKNKREKKKKKMKVEKDLCNTWAGPTFPTQIREKRFSFLFSSLLFFSFLFHPSGPWREKLGRRESACCLLLLKSHTHSKKVSIEQMLATVQSY